MFLTRKRLQPGEALPGFGHRLYPQGDPRARLLMEMVGEDYGKSLVPGRGTWTRYRGRNDFHA